MSRSFCLTRLFGFSLGLKFGGLAYLAGERVFEVSHLDLWIMFVCFGAFLMQLKHLSVAELKILVLLALISRYLS